MHYGNYGRSFWDLLCECFLWNMMIARAQGSIDLKGQQEARGERGPGHFALGQQVQPVRALSRGLDNVLGLDVQVEVVLPPGLGPGLPQLA
eukprot:scaffold97843_cov25-Prasinocladus_malaysianus.AAC.1